MYTYPVKGLSNKLMQFKGPIIFISNYNKVNEDALVNRLKFVNADVPITILNYSILKYRYE